MRKLIYHFKQRNGDSDQLIIIIFNVANLKHMEKIGGWMEGREKGR